jgi:hypothetical protein
MFLRRLGKYSILFSISITLFINDCFALLIDNVTGQYETARASFNTAVTSINNQTSSVLYRWTFGWFVSPPSLPEIPEIDPGAIALYHILNFIQFAVFICMIAWVLRWIYADSRVNNTSFSALMMIAVVSNAFIYLLLRFFVLSIVV